jgi:5-methylcytosine-specific restriction endonuclease McrA
VSDYTSKRYRRMRAQFRDACWRNRLACSICHSVIDYSLTFPNPWAWELHHVQPSSLAPHLHYVHTNFAPSHARCNKSQSANPKQEWVQPTW